MHRIPRGLVATSDFQNFVRVHGQLMQLAGTPPFDLSLDTSVEALSFEELRRCILQLVGKGVQLQRFKGLGEMNASQLKETTMDPDSRTLVQVTMEDATQAALVFSMLMGDKVEPRREFIEQNARAVANLDV